MNMRGKCEEEQTNIKQRQTKTKNCKAKKIESLLRRVGGVWPLILDG